MSPFDNEKYFKLFKGDEIDLFTYGFRFIYKEIDIIYT